MRSLLHVTGEGAEAARVARRLLSDTPMLSTCLAVVIAASPTLESSTAAELAIAEADRKIAQLEEQRPSAAWVQAGSAISIVGGVASAAGLVVALIGIANSCPLFSRCAATGTEGFFTAGGTVMGIASLVSVAGAIMAVTFRLLRSGATGRHIARLEEQRAVLVAGDHLDRTKMLAIADRHRPSFGPAVTLFTFGGAGTVAGIVMVALFHSTGSVAGQLSAGVLPLLVGVGLTALGFRELGLRNRENDEIDMEIPPLIIGSRLPAANTLVGWAWAF